MYIYIYIYRCAVSTLIQGVKDLRVAHRLARSYRGLSTNKLTKSTVTDAQRYQTKKMAAIDESIGTTA